VADADNSARSYKLEERFGPIALGAAILGLVIGVLDSLLKIVTFVESSFYLSTITLWVVVLAFSKYYPEKGTSRFPIRRTWIVGGATALLLFCVSWTYYDHHIRVTRPPEHPTIRLSYRSVETVYAAEQSLKLTSFYLDEDLCSFEERKEPLFADGRTVRTFAVNRDVVGAFRGGKCSGLDGEKPMVAVLPVLRKYVISSGKAKFAEYLNSPEDLGRVVRDRGDVFSQILPTSDELLAMKERAPDDYAALKKWILSCIGVYQPVFTIVLTNTRHVPVDIVRVEYDVKQVGQVLGGEQGGPVWPEVTFDHELVHSVGVQSFQLKPIINVPAGATKAFNVRLFTRDVRPGLGWYLSIRVIDSGGGSVVTDRFQLYLNPK
jgi:hypothetical protein